MSANALSPRQKMLYQYAVDVYDIPTAASYNISQGDPVPNVKTLTAVLCYLESTPEVDEVTAIGLTQQINTFTLDLFHFAAGTAIRNGQYFKMVATPAQGASLVGVWWHCQGSEQTHERLANKLMVRAKRIPQPSWA